MTSVLPSAEHFFVDEEDTYEEYKVYYELPSSTKKAINIPSDTAIVYAVATECPFGLIDLLDKLPESVEYLDLGHDGITSLTRCKGSNEWRTGTSKQETVDVIKNLLHGLPNLRKISICHYYCEFKEELKSVLKDTLINLHEIE